MIKNKETISKINKEQQKSKIKRLKSLNNDPSLLFLPIASELLTQKISEINLTQSNIESNIESINEEITQYNNNPNEQNKNYIINRRNGILNQINSIESKKTQIKKLLTKLETVITIFKTITTTLKLLPLPTSPIPITLGIINTSSSLLEKATKTISAFKTIITIIKGEIGEIDNNLLEIQDKTNIISNQIETNVFTTLTSDNNAITNNLIKIGTLNEQYKGFKFAIKEESDINAPTVNKLKRHYTLS